MKTWAIAAILILVVLSACAPAVPATPAPCSIQASEFIDQLDKISQKWDDANAVANSTARISLSGAISDLQAVRRELDGLEPPSCAAPVQEAALKYMQSKINAYISFMADDPDYLFKHKLEISDTDYSNYVTLYGQMVASGD